jgi:hypothetical protein
MHCEEHHRESCLIENKQAGRLSIPYIHRRQKFRPRCMVRRTRFSYKMSALSPSFNAGARVSNGTSSSFLRVIVSNPFAHRSRECSCAEAASLDRWLGVDLFLSCLSVADFFVGMPTFWVILTVLDSSLCLTGSNHDQ